MSCECAKPIDEYHGWKCSITDGACLYLVPNQKECHQLYEDVPDPEEEYTNIYGGTYRTCKSCGEIFYIRKQEKDWFFDRGLSLPKRCIKCRIARKAQRKDSKNAK